MMHLQKHVWLAILSAACCSCNSKSGDPSGTNPPKAILKDSNSTQSNEATPPKRVTQSSNIPIVTYTIPVGETYSLIDSSEDQDLRVGVGGANDRVTFFFPNRPGFKYHVLSPYGQDLYVEAAIEKGKLEQCEDSIPIWKIKYKYDKESFAQKLKSDKSFAGDFLVIGTQKDIRIKPPYRTEPAESTKAMCLAALKPDTKGYSCNYFPVGRVGNVERILVEANGRSGIGFIGVVDTDGENYAVQFKTNDGWIDGAYFKGQADLDGDGLSDIFLLHYGDYGGYQIIALRNGTWISIHNHGPQTC